MTQKTKAAEASSETHLSVHLVGQRPIMFDRYAGDNQTKLRPADKVYLSQEDGETLVLTSENVMSFLGAVNTDSAPKLVTDKRKYKDLAKALNGFVTVEQAEIAFLRDGKPIKFVARSKLLDNPDAYDAETKLYISNKVPRLPKGIPNPNRRPVLELPWELKLDLTAFQHPDPSINILESLRACFDRGGKCIGFGTYRGVYGKFSVERWEEL